MKSLVFFFLVALVALTQGEDNSTNRRPTLPTTTAATTTTTTPKTPTPTPSTPKPPTPTPKPPTPSSTTTTTTTAAPPTTKPTAPSTTTAAPPKDYDWRVVDSNTVCILAKMNINLELKVKGEHRDAHFVVPKNATSWGKCGELEQFINIAWPNKGSANQTNSLAFWFNMDNKTQEYHISFVELNITDNNDKMHSFNRSLNIYETKNNTAYSCTYSSPILMKLNESSISVDLSELRIQAFLKATPAKADFTNVYSCTPDSPDLVPILVGVGLTLLIVIVLIAYLISRRYSTRGYHSM